MIEVDRLVKKFDEVTAVDDISFEVKEGESFGFLGPNGAGKTTTIRILTTLILPTSGRGRVNGYDIAKESDRVRESIGIIFQEPSLDERLTAYDNLYFHAALYRVPKREIRPRIEKALTMVELRKFKDKVVNTFSGGMKRRLEIARGFLHMPRVLFLDEPTLGLDPQTRRVIWEYIRKLKDDFGVTLFLTTHYMEEAEESDRVGIIHKGKIVAVDSPENMKKSIGRDTIVLSNSDGNERAVRALGFDVVRAGDKLMIGVDSSEDALRKILNGGVSLENLMIKRPTLEDVFIEITGTAIADEPGNSMSLIKRAVRMRRMK
ncbi:MAG: ATP-binding cassette domain-containing protein [Deltaproteobacteria bacterium]|uniref:ATP-binding cassette domain-containing protein n=1 Tax=Candidatus Zymogenus saltonus TaxID=2844893 RepID=A0A9D8PM05_9DELT|nr:ATP-binding cassette domain-containing protein [Candidatus Zymogenus saltonus]